MIEIISCVVIYRTCRFTKPKEKDGDAGRFALTHFGLLKILSFHEVRKMHPRLDELKIIVLKATRRPLLSLAIFVDLLSGNALVKKIVEKNSFPENNFTFLCQIFLSASCWILSPQRIYALF